MLIWLVVILCGILVGGVCFSFFEGRNAVLLSVLISWVMFLFFNLYFEFYSKDREIMQGGWFLFQLVLGSFVVLVSVVGGWLVKKISGRK